MIEKYIEQQLGASLASFDLAAFCAELSARAGADETLLDHPALEMLFAYTDFEAFKSLMLSTREGASVEAAGGSLCVSGEMLGLSGSGIMGSAPPMGMDDDAEDTGSDMIGPDLFVQGCKVGGD